jgi:hypothetical protein
MKKFRLRHNRHKKGFVVVHVDGREPTIYLDSGKPLDPTRPMPPHCAHLLRLARKAQGLTEQKCSATMAGHDKKWSKAKGARAA